MNGRENQVWVIVWGGEERGAGVRRERVGRRERRGKCMEGKGSGK